MKCFRIRTIGNNKSNQTMQKEDQSTNQTSEAIQQNVSDVVTNISKGAKSVGSNITTEIAKEVAENIGKKLQDLAKVISCLIYLFRITKKLDNYMAKTFNILE
jgi:hypothetical protein